MGVRGHAASGVARNVVVAVSSPTGLTTGVAGQLSTTDFNSEKACAPPAGAAIQHGFGAHPQGRRGVEQRDLAAGRALRLARERAVAQVEGGDGGVGAVIEEAHRVRRLHVGLAQDEPAEHGLVGIDRPGRDRGRRDRGCRARGNLGRTFVARVQHHRRDREPDDERHDDERGGDRNDRPSLTCAPGRRPRRGPEPAARAESSRDRSPDRRRDRDRRSRSLHAE